MGKTARGFTLLELLLFIVVLGVIVAVIFSLVNPLKRINQAKDAKIRNDIDQIANGLQWYMAMYLKFPADPATALVASGDLKTYPTSPDGTPYEYERSADCDSNPTNCKAVVYKALYDPVRTGNVWCWRSVTGKIEELAAASCVP